MGFTMIHTKTLAQRLILVCIFVLSMSTQGFGAELLPAGLQDDASDIATDVESNFTNVSQIMQTMLDNQNLVIISVTAENKIYQESLYEEIEALKQLNENINDEFKPLYTIYRRSKDYNQERPLILQQVKRFYYQLTNLYKPLVSTKNFLELRIQQLDNLAFTLKNIDDDDMRAIVAEALRLKDECEVFYAAISKELPKIQISIDNLKNAETELNSKLYTFWLEYYTNFKIDLEYYAPTWATAAFWATVTDSLKITIIRELPTTPHEWYTFFLNILLLFIPFFMMGVFLYWKVDAFFENKNAKKCKVFLTTSLPWMILGICIQYASWYEGNRYQIVNAIGTFIFCFGQIRFSWDLLCLKRRDSYTKRSPFLLLCGILICSYLMMNFLEVSRVFSSLWGLFLVYLLIARPSKPSKNFPLPRILIKALYAAVLVALICLCYTGLVRISVFLVLAPLCLIMGIHQVQSCVHALSLLKKRLPQSGFAFLGCGMLYIFALPVLLCLALFTPFIWVLTFPSGEFLINSLSNFHFSIGAFSVNTLEILAIITVAYLINAVIKLVYNYIDNTWAGHNHEGFGALITPIKSILFFGAWSVFVLYVLNSVGFNLSSLAVVAGGLSVGVGLGMKEFIQNSFSGFLLIFGQNIREGDYVEVGALRGTVVKVGLRATTIRTVINSILFIPNSQFINSSFINWTHNGHRVRCSIFLGVAYGSNLELMKKIIVKIIESDERIIQREPIEIFFIDFAASALNFEIRFWVYNSEDQRVILSDIRYAINQAFEKNDITIPFPQSDVNLKTHLNLALNQDADTKTYSPASEGNSINREVFDALPDNSHLTDIKSSAYKTKYLTKRFLVRKRKRKMNKIFAFTR